MMNIGQVSVWGMKSLAWASVGVFFLWSIGAIYHFALLPPWMTFILSAGYSVGGVYSFWKMPVKSQWLSLCATSIVMIYFLTWLQQPKSDRNWDRDQSRMPRVAIQDGRVSIQNFRRNIYRSESDYEPNFGRLDFELDQLSRVWFLVQRFTTMEGLAHTFLTFEVESKSGPQYFSVSVEIRREAGEVYSPIQGMYRQYEITYVIGAEEDLIGVRTVMRPNDRVFMYPTNADPSQVQQLFREIADRTNGLNDSPEFYNTFLNNCTNNIVWHTYKLTPRPVNWLDPRIVMPGFSDRYAFEKGLIGQPGQSFEELAKASRIDLRARAFGINEGFSKAIRSQ